MIATAYGLQSAAAAMSTRAAAAPLVQRLVPGCRSPDRHAGVADGRGRPAIWAGMVTRRLVRENRSSSAMV